MIIGKTRTNQPVEKEQGFDTEVQELMEQGEPMSGYTAEILPKEELLEIENVYTGIVKNGNKLTFVSALNVTRKATLTGSQDIIKFNVPSEIMSKLYPSSIGGYNALSYFTSKFFVETGGQVELGILTLKESSPDLIRCYIQGDFINNLPENYAVYVRIEMTFLISDNLI